MRAVLLTGFGGPEKLQYRDDVAEPQPGAGEVRIRVGAAALNNTDIWTREGAYGSADDPNADAGWRREPLAFPRIQGADIAGRIDRVGAGVAEDRVGERVLVDPMLYSGDERAGHHRLPRQRARRRIRGTGDRPRRERPPGRQCAERRRAGHLPHRLHHRHADAESRRGRGR
ncbi:alcohol dehydrogenase catalytic domain-containing protein [Murinocardiopsis flavida]|uniref:alcohol dehydrogenase catalytic domain-containing protein n=1 Tax=Murinocardiopsis flavida TaxID=645275 RepID=UPI001FE9D981|nr:alcohol dehydrogenase catalytic domain-containing protein [Murinocardiopsis flavida]